MIQITRPIRTTSEWLQSVKRLPVIQINLYYAQAPH
jgi:hypothetical protein